MIKRKGTTKHVLVLSGDNLKPEAVNQLRTSLGITDQVQSGLILTEGVNYVGRYEIGNADDRKLSRRHVQFTVQPGVLYKHVTVCLLGTNPSVFQRIRDDGFKEKFFMEKDKTYTMAPGDVVWLLKDLYPLKLEEIMVTVQARTASSSHISESSTAKIETDQTNSQSHSNPETLSEFPQNRELPQSPNQSSSSLEPEHRNSEDLFAQEMSAMIEELREQYLQSIQTKPHPPNQNPNQNGSNNNTPKSSRKNQSPENSPDKHDFKKEFRSSKEQLVEKKLSRAEELDIIRKLYVATQQRAEEEHRRVEELKEQLREASEKVMKIHVIAQTKRAGVSDENSKNPSKKDSRKTVVFSQDSSTTVASSTRDDLFIDFESMLVTYESRKRSGTPYSSPTPIFTTPIASQQPSVVGTPIQSNTPTRSNSYTQIPDILKGSGESTPNRITRTNSPLKNELSNEDLNQILSRTRSNSHFVSSSSIKASTSLLSGGGSPKSVCAIPIFPGITLETQDVVEFQMNTDVRKQLAKLNQQPVAKQKSATAGRAPKQRSTVVGRQSSESIGQNKSP